MVLAANGAPDTGEYYDPRNFLVKGGQRAFEQKIVAMNKAAVQELRGANQMLAEELLKVTAGSNGVYEQLQQANAKLSSAQAAVDSASKERRVAEKRHLVQLKELNKRYKEEQAQRLLLEAELTRMRMEKEQAMHQVEGLQDESAQLKDLANSLRSNAARLEATVSADAATIAELRARLLSAESRLADETAAHQDAFARLKIVEADLKLVSERHSALTGSHSEADARLRATVSKLEIMQDDLQSTRATLQAEKVACMEERQRAEKLQGEVARLQSSIAMGAASAASDKSELERLRSELAQALSSNEGLRHDCSKLREENLHLTAASVAQQSTLQQTQQAREELQLQLQAAREALEKQVAQLQESWQADVASKEATFRDELGRKDAELIEVRERMLQAQSSVADLAKEVATFKHQAEHYAETFRQNEQLQERLADAQAAARSQGAALSDATSTLGAQLELWKAEAAEVAQAAAKWKQRATTLQGQLEEKDGELTTAKTECATLNARLSTGEAERVRLQETLASLDSKLALASQEAASYRSQLQEVLTAHSSSSRQAETYQQELQARDLQLDKLQLRLGEEQAKVSQLRSELAHSGSQHVKELDAKAHMLTDVTASLQAEERMRMAAQAEAAQLRKQLDTMTRELNRTRAISDAAQAHATQQQEQQQQQQRPGFGNAASNGWKPAANHRPSGAGRMGAQQPDVARGYLGAAAAYRTDQNRDRDISMPSSLEAEAESWFSRLSSSPQSQQRYQGGGGRQAGVRYDGPAAAAAAAAAAASPPRAHDSYIVDLETMTPRLTPAGRGQAAGGMPTVTVPHAPPPFGREANSAVPEYGADAGTFSAYTAYITPLPAPGSPAGGRAGQGYVPQAEPQHRRYIPPQSNFPPARPFGAYGPSSGLVSLSPAISETASTDSTHLQERLQRLLGTGTLL